MRKYLLVIILLAACTMGMLSCSLRKPQFYLNISTIPPRTAAAQVPVKVMASVGSNRTETMTGNLRLKISSGGAAPVIIDEKTVSIAPESVYAYEFVISTPQCPGKNVLSLEFVPDCSPSSGVYTERDIYVVPSQKRSRGVLDGAWVGLYHWSEEEGKHWNDDIRELSAEDWKGIVRSMHAAGMDIIVLQELFRHEAYVGRHSETVESYDGKAFYPSELYPGRMPVECADPVDAILSEASELGMHVFLGVGMFAWFDFSGESLKWHKAVTGELLRLYGHYPSFYGFYVSEESGGSLDNWEKTPELRKQRTDEIISFFAEYKRFCRSAAPEKPIMLATNSMGISNREDAYASLLQNLDILCPFGFARMPEDDISGQEAAALLQKWCDDSGCHLWFDLEAFLFNPDGSLYPRPIGEIVRDLNMFDNFETVLCYQYPGVFNNPDMHPQVGDSLSVTLYKDYLHYLETKD